MPIFTHRFFLLICSLCFCLSDVSFAADGPKKPHQIIDELRQRMYAIGETTGRYGDFVEAEQKAAVEIRKFIVSGDSIGLVETNDIGQTPLMAAAFMGYSELVSELLKSDKVRNAINDTNPKGMSAWLYANFAYRQAVWVCNPAVFKDPFSFIPLFVTQPYYLQSAENPYKKTRRLLEDAGAKADLAKAKQYWLDTCKSQSGTMRTKVQESSDLLDTVVTEGTETSTSYFSRNLLAKMLGMIGVPASAIFLLVYLGALFSRRVRSFAFRLMFGSIGFGLVASLLMWMTANSSLPNLFIYQSALQVFPFGFGIGGLVLFVVLFSRSQRAPIGAGR